MTENETAGKYHHHHLHLYSQKKRRPRGYEMGETSINWVSRKQLHDIYSNTHCMKIQSGHY
jgi:hypothetical protein